MKKRMFRLQENEVERLNFRLIVITVSMALLYLTISIWQALKGSSGADHLNAALSVHPRSIILLAWVAAAIGVAFMPEIGKIFAAVALLGVVALFGYWGYVTAVIKTNINVDQLSQASLAGNWFVGATFFDVATLVIAIAVVAYDIRLIYKNLQLRFKKDSLLHADSPAMVVK